MIQLYHASQRYQNGIEALRDVSLRVHEGEFVFIAGRSGAGKSTLLRLIAGDEPPTEGQIIVTGRNLSVIRPAQLPYFRRNIGRLWQDFQLLADRTIAENTALPLEVLGLPRDSIRARVEQVLELVGMSAYADSYPRWLSGGEQQKVAIARALVNEPSILIADEPTGNLDGDLACEIIQMLRDIRGRGTTVVVATHDRALLELFKERVVLLNQGFVIEDDGDPGGAEPAFVEEPA